MFQADRDEDALFVLRIGDCASHRIAITVQRSRTKFLGVSTLHVRDEPRLKINPLEAAPHSPELKPM